jgi:hypothetical protein
LIPDLPGWGSLPTVTRFHNWAEMAGMAALVFAEIVAYKYGHRKDDLTEQQQTAANQRHDEEMARLHLETAKANERAAALNAALDKEREKTSPRTWKKEQFDAIQSVRGKVTDVGVLVQRNCLECFMFANHLELALHQAGVRLYGDDSLPTGQLTGIAVYLPQLEMDHSETHPLVIALRAAELNPFVIRHNPPEFSQMRTDIPVIVVGEKRFFLCAAIFSEYITGYAVDAGAASQAISLRARLSRKRMPWPVKGVKYIIPIGMRAK